MGKGLNTQVTAIVLGTGLGVVTGLFFWAPGSPRPKGLPPSAGVSSSTSSGDPGEGRPRPPVPSVRGTPESAAEQIADPISPKYDPVRLSMATSAREVYSHEPRLESWAAPIEKHLEQRVLQDLQRVPGISNLMVECRSTGCQVLWNATSSKASFHAGNVMIVLYNGAVGGQWPQGFVTFFRGRGFEDIDALNPQEVIRRLDQRREERLKEQRESYARGAPRYRTMPLEYWPEG
jgi:hypothetical protein